MNPVISRNKISNKLFNFFFNTIFYGISLKKISWDFEFNHPIAEVCSSGIKTIEQIIQDYSDKSNDGDYSLSTLLLQIANPINEKNIIILQTFDILKPLRAIGDNVSRKLARQFIVNWINAHQTIFHKYWRGAGWQPDLVGYRIANWAINYMFFGYSADEEFRKLFSNSFIHQTCHLIKVYKSLSEPITKFRALKGIIFGIYLIPKASKYFDGFIKEYEKLAEFIAQDALNEGNALSFYPANVFILLKDMIEVKSLLKPANYSVDKLQSAIQTLSLIIRLLRHSDGGLSNFHGLANNISK
jgi:uncharacterized heparinase superfamily protein